MSNAPDGASDTGVWLHNGRLHLTHSAYARYLRNCPAVALMVRDARWLLMPLLSGAGGLQVKQRNAQGDRVIEAQEFFRSQGHEDSPQLRPIVLHEDIQAGGLFMEFAA